MRKQVTLKQKISNKESRKKINRGLYKLINGLINLSHENKFYEKVFFQNKLLAYNTFLNFGEQYRLSKEKYQNHFAENF
jgi:hypothetical protein